MNRSEDLLDNVNEANPGDIVTAEVLTIDNDQANVVIEGTGVEGVLTFRESANDRDADISDFIKTGDTIEVLVLRQVIGKDTDTATPFVSKKCLEARKAWDKFVGREDGVAAAKGTRAVRGGLPVEFEGLRGLIPTSVIDTRFVRNTEKFVSQELEAKIKEVVPAEDRFIPSRRGVVEEKAVAAREEVFSRLEEGVIIKDKIARLTSFDALIDLGGVGGLAHVTELPHKRSVSPKSVVSVSGEVEVKAPPVDEGVGRASLSPEVTTSGPWDGVKRKLAAGDVVEGKARCLTDLGVLVEVLPGIGGLVHISQVSHKRVENPKDVLSVGQEVNAKVPDVNTTAKRVPFSIKIPKGHSVQAENEEGRQSRPCRPKREAKRDYELPGVQTGFSMADLFGDIEL